MVSVTQRIEQVKQPGDGYINPKLMEGRLFDNGSSSPLDHKVENIDESLVVSAVGSFVRLANGAAPREAFAVSLQGARTLGDEVHARAVAEVDSLGSGQVDASTIAVACRLSGYDVAYRVGAARYSPEAHTTPDAATIEHIRVMVDRSLAFFWEQGPITLAGFSFPGAFTELVTDGDGDFLTADTVWDLKVSVSGPTKDHTLELLMYLLMGKRSGQPEFAIITHLGVFNPRLNSAYRIALSDVPVEVIEEVSSDVIGY